MNRRKNACSNSISHSDLPQISHLYCKHPKGNFLLNIPDFSFPLLFTVCYPRLHQYSDTIRHIWLLCVEKKRYLAVISAFTVCHVLLLPIDLFFFHCCRYSTHPAVECCWCLCALYSVTPLVLLRGKWLFSDALCYLPGSWIFSFDAVPVYFFIFDLLGYILMISPIRDFVAYGKGLCG